MEQCQEDQVEEVRHFSKFRKHEHHCYDNLVKNKDFQILLQQLSQENRMQHKFMDMLAQETGINKETLRTWRGKLKKDKDYKPIHGPHVKNIVLPQSAIQKIVKTIHDDYLSSSRYLPPRAFKSIALREAHSQGIENFKASRSWCNHFLKANNLSVRKPHVQRRTKPNDAIISSFLSDFEVACMQYQPRLIFNADETCWRVCNGIIKTISYRGADSVAINSMHDTKEGITVLATVNKAGEKLPLWVLATGSTVRSENKFRQDKRIRHIISSKKIEITHSASGWFTEQIAIKYVKWLSEKINGRNAYLIWDLHSSHQTPLVKKTLCDLGIGVSFVPAGQTGVWQPLDNKIFGNIKMRAQAKLDEMMAEKDLKDIDLIDAILILYEIWEELNIDTVKKAWMMFN